jgi:hypothetical protein
LQGVEPLGEFRPAQELLVRFHDAQVLGGLGVVANGLKLVEYRQTLSRSLIK